MEARLPGLGVEVPYDGMPPAGEAALCIALSLFICCWLKALYGNEFDVWLKYGVMGALEGNPGVIGREFGKLLLLLPPPLGTDI